MARLEAGGGSLSALLPAATEPLGPHDARRVRAWCHELARHHHRLDALLRPLLSKPLKAKDRDLHWLLELGLLQADENEATAPLIVDATVEAVAPLGKEWARGLVNAVLRRALREREALRDGLDEAARLSHPVWLLDMFKVDWPDAWQDLARADDERAPMTVRAAGDRQTCLDALADAGIAARAGERATTAVVLDAPVDVDRLPGFATGGTSVQDEAAQLAASLLAEAVEPGARLLDACAAPGGKTAHALQTGHFGEIVALDADAERLERVSATLVRLGRPDGARLVAADAAEVSTWWDGAPFDAVLLDAPCSGTGVIRRHPDIKLLRLASDVPTLVAAQARLLDALWGVLAPGGRLLYATCSVSKDENERQVTAFLARTPDARTLPLPPCAGAPRPVGEGAAPAAQIMTGESGADGFFYALLGREPT